KILSSKRCSSRFSEGVPSVSGAGISNLWRLIEKWRAFGLSNHGLFKGHKTRQCRRETNQRGNYGVRVGQLVECWRWGRVSAQHPDCPNSKPFGRSYITVQAVSHMHSAAGRNTCLFQGVLKDLFAWFLNSNEIGQRNDAKKFLKPIPAQGKQRAFTRIFHNA